MVLHGPLYHLFSEIFQEGFVGLYNGMENNGLRDFLILATKLDTAMME